MSYAMQYTEEIKLTYISLDAICPNPYQPRKIFDQQALKELTESIIQYGVMQPIHVRPAGGNQFELIAGERRWRASKLAGLTIIPAIILHANDKDSALIALLENLQRQDLNFFEEATGFQNIINDYKITQDELARKMGKSQSTIANKLRLLRLSEEIKEFVLKYHLTERHARAILKIAEEEIQMKILQTVVKNGLTVKLTEDLVEREITAMEERKNFHMPPKQQKIKRYIKDLRLFTNTISHAVKTMETAGVKIRYLKKENESQILYQILVNKS